MPLKNILTIDLEDWFHICGVGDYLPRETWPKLESRIVDNTRRILNLLDRARTCATFFVLGSVAERFPELISTIHQAGHEISSHGYSHQRVYTMTKDSFREDIKRSVDILTDITGVAVKGYRAPEWSVRDDSLWALDILLEQQMAYDSSMAPLHIIGNPSYSRIPRIHKLSHGSLWELPPLTISFPGVNFPAGGGWGLRTFPYRMICSEIRRWNRQGMPAVMFFHPREFDSGCPQVTLPLIKRLVINGGFSDTEKRLARLLRDFEFTSVLKSGFLGEP